MSRPRKRRTPSSDVPHENQKVDAGGQGGPDDQPRPSGPEVERAVGKKQSKWPPDFAQWAKEDQMAWIRKNWSPVSADDPIFKHPVGVFTVHRPAKPADDPEEPDEVEGGTAAMINDVENPHDEPVAPPAKLVVPPKIREVTPDELNHPQRRTQAQVHQVALVTLSSLFPEEKEETTDRPADERRSE